MTRNALRIVDAHHHLWDREALPYPWLAAPNPDSMVGDTTPLCRNYLIDDYMADAVGFDLVASVHVQAEVAHDRAVDETRWLQQVADSHGCPRAIVAYADLSAPDLERVLDGHAACSAFRGIRQILNRHPVAKYNYVERDYMQDERWQDGLGQLVRRGLSFDMQLYPEQMKEAAATARRHPDLPIILNHTGMPWDQSDEGIGRWREGMRLLAACPNVSVKISGLGMMDHRWSCRSIRPLVLATIDMFTPARCMFASNFPVDRLFSDYRAIWNAFDIITADFSPEERRAMFASNAAQRYRV
jgi:predicted TIM-barrel fold metal-dependent hydrolase